MVRLFIYLYTLAVFALAQNTQLQSGNKKIKAGLVEVVLQDQDAGNITISYQTPMQDSSYLRIATPAYISNFVPDNGLQISTNCSGAQSSTQLFCSVLANTTSSSNIIYMTYLVSDEQDFLVGTFYREFLLNGTSLITNVQQQVNLGLGSPIASAKGQIGLVPFISGVSSLDEDFQLQLGLTQSFNTLTSTLQLQIKIQEFHTKTIIVIFSYILFLPQVYIFSSYQDYTFEPDNNAINKQVIFYIRQINNRTASLPTTRRLQTISIRPNSSLTKTEQTNTGTNDGVLTQQQFEKIIRSGNFSLRNMRVRTITKPAEKVQIPKASSTLIAPSLTFETSPAAPIAPSTVQMRSSQSAETIQPIQPIQPATPQQNEFADIFASNGMTIILNASVSDPIIYLQLNPYVDIQTIGSRAAAAMALIKPMRIEIVIRQTPPAKIQCPRGFLVLRLKKIDSIQQAYEYQCIICLWAQYFDWSLEKCVPFPNISTFNNVVEPA